MLNQEEGSKREAPPKARNGSDDVIFIFARPGACFSVRRAIIYQHACMELCGVCVCHEMRWLEIARTNRKSSIKERSFTMAGGSLQATCW